MVVHLDLDGATAIYAMRGWSYPSRTDALFDSGLSNALRFFDALGVRATLMVIAEDLDDPAKRHLLVDAVSSGHEIASHALTHRVLTDLDRDGKWREINDSRRSIEATLGVDVRGFRAPGFHIDRESLELVAAAGYAYDSSLFSTANCARRIGTAKVSRAPHRPVANSPLLELPLPMHAPLPLPFHPSYSLVLGDWHFHAGLKRFLVTRAPLVLLFHLTDFADPLPAAERPNWAATFYTLSFLSAARKHECCQRMLGWAMRDYQLTDTAQLLASLAKAERRHGVGQPEPM